MLLLGVGYYLLLSPALETLEQERVKEQDLRQVFLVKKTQAINLAAYREQMVEIEKTFGALLRQLPDKSQIDGLLTDINQAGLSRGLEFELFKPGKETQAEFYAEMPIAIKVLGTYHDLGAFASDISKLSRIVTIGDINVQTQPLPKDAKPSQASAALVIEAVAKTYRYLDADEVAAKQKAEKEAKAKAGKKSGK
ncbi:MAG: pilus assembly protein PilO [Mehylophilales bacterium 35-46-6]|nr:MAG: pilus assembly protein PilO [Mehylophilales bacterium 35-46-6]